MRTGGAERHWATLIPALRDRGVDAGVVCLAGEGDLFGELVGRGVPSISLGMRSRLDARGLRRALGFASPRPDAVVTRGVSAQLVGAAIARRAQAPHVLNEHTPLTPAGQLVAPRPHQRALTRLVAPHVDAVIAVTERQTEPLAALGYRREGIEVIANGVFTARRRGAGARRRRLRGALRGRPAAGEAGGRVHPRRGGRAPRAPGDRRRGGGRGAGARAARRPRRSERCGAARRARRCARPDRGRERDVPDRARPRRSR